MIHPGARESRELFKNVFQSPLFSFQWPKNASQKKIGMLKEQKSNSKIKSRALLTQIGSNPLFALVSLIKLNYQAHMSYFLLCIDLFIPFSTSLRLSFIISLLESLIVFPRVIN